MKSKYIIGSMVAATAFLIAGIASAQVMSAPNGPVNVTTTPSTTGVTPGSSGTTFGTINISGNGGGAYSISSIPLAVTPSSGASAGNLSNCQLFNSSGSALNSGVNVMSSLANGSNTFTFDTPFSVTGATTTLSIRCNVSSSAASGSTYQFVAGTPVFSPGLGLMVSAAPSVPAGTQSAALGLITLDGTRSGTSVNVSSVPVTLTFNGASTSEFTNCGLRNVNNLGTPLNTGVNALGTLNTNGSVNTVTLDTPLSVPAGGIQVLALTCDVASVTPAGSSVTISVDPTTVSSRNSSTGASITPTAGVTATGGAAPIMGTVEITAPGTTVTPGVPNTGAGGEAPMNLALLAISGAVLLFGVGTLALRRR